MDTAIYYWAKTKLKWYENAEILSQEIREKLNYI